MKVEITQEHINKGTRGSSYYCPIALAIKEKTDRGIQVAPWYVRTLDDKVPHVFLNNPKEVEEFIREFDAGNEVSPGLIVEFEL